MRKINLLILSIFLVFTSSLLCFGYIHAGTILLTICFIQCFLGLVSSITKILLLILRTRHQQKPSLKSVAFSTKSVVFT